MFFCIVYSTLVLNVSFLYYFLVWKASLYFSSIIYIGAIAEDGIHIIVKFATKYQRTCEQSLLLVPFALRVFGE